MERREEPLKNLRPGQTHSKKPYPSILSTRRSSMTAPVPTRFHYSTTGAYSAQSISRCRHRDLAPKHGFDFDMF